MYGLMMDTTANPKQTDSRHVMVARADEELAHAHEQITRAHEEIGRTEEQLSELQHDAARQPSDHRAPTLGSSAEPHEHVSPCCPEQPALAWQAGGTRLH